MTSLLRRAAERVATPRPIRALSLAVAAARGRGLVLVYHRLGASGAATAVVPTIGADLFEAQVGALRQAGEIVPLRALLDGRRRSRPRFALTFDDDNPAHLHVTLPVLRRLRLPATFFLSGRALWGLGPYWFERLEARVAVHGVAATAGWLGLTATSVASLARACEDAPDAVARLEADDQPARPPAFDAAAIAALAAAGMEIGFHTVGHRVLPSLDDASLAAALDHGRDALAAAAGAPVDFVAYPHGRGDARVAAAAARAGFVAGFVTGGRPVDAGAPMGLLGRWEAGPLAGTALLADVALRLHLPVRP